MKTAKQELGSWGEDIVARYYRDLGYDIVARNFRCSFGELDLICSRQGILYSIEVKTRRSLIFGYPEESITPQKQARLMRLTAAFLELDTKVYKAIHIQVCAVLVTDSKVMLRIYTVL